LTLVLLVAGTVPAQASEPRASHSPFDAVWQLILKFIPSYSTAPPTPSQKNDADTGSGVDPNGGDRGAGTDPSGFVGTSGSEVPTTGFESSPAIDPNGSERSPAMDPDGAS
jgi:hypothetical protein